MRDPERYHLTIYGTPSGTAAWGWRFEGHHLSLNFTLAGDHVAVDAPSFLGANPARVPKGPRAGQRALATEEDEARALLESLSEAQRREAVFAAYTRCLESIAAWGHDPAGQAAQCRAGLGRLVGRFEEPLEYVPDVDGRVRVAK